MSKRCLKRKSERHLRKTSWRDLDKICCRCLCLIEDDLQMTYQKMPYRCRCLIGDDLQMSYQKMSCMRCPKDDLHNLTMLCIIYL